jgi:hemin uptake protein HemP
MLKYQTPANVSLQTGTVPDVTSVPRGMTSQHIDSRRLMSGASELVIEHAGQKYRLRLTRNDKLILTK